MTINVQISLSDACITLNFHGFFNTINIDVTGGGYKCFNVAVNAESDVVNINYSSSGCSQNGGFTSNYYIYGKTTLVNYKTSDSQTTTNVYENLDRARVRALPLRVDHRPDHDGDHLDLGI